MAAVDTNLYVFGGLSQESGWFDDVHKFDTGKRKDLLPKTEIISLTDSNSMRLPLKNDCFWWSARMVIYVPGGDIFFEFLN